MRRVSRRHLLQGAAGVALGLPLLEAMAGTGTAEIPRRLLLCFAGISGGIDGDENKVHRMKPVACAEGYTLPPAMQALEAVRSRISLVSGLEIPQPHFTEPAPSGGRNPGNNSFHFHCNPLFTGMRQEGDQFGATVTGTSADQVLARHTEGETVFPSLAWRVQASFYQGDLAERGVMSYREEDGIVTPIVPTTSPLQAYLQLTGQVQPSDASARAAWEANRLRSRSVLDLVDRRISGLLPSLGRTDQARIEQHFDQVRDLEVRLASAYAVEGGICVPAEIDGDPAVDESLAWSDETTRASLFNEALVLALGCDLSRAFSLMFTTMQSNLFIGAATGFSTRLHELFHLSDCAAAEAAIAWHMERFAELLARLDSVPEGDGTLLDHCAVLLVPEGGYGPLSPDSAQEERWSHSTQEMVCVVAGNGDHIRLGELVDVTDAPFHPTQLMNSLLASIGIEDEVGEVPGGVPGVLV